ncbi:MAG: glycerate kinase, partial [Caldilineaceae bacterium]|nr:glycerate kinase [Caldilineaceae bacterium]
DAAAEFERRWQWLNAALPQLQPFFAARQFPDTWFLPLWSVWLPLACQLQDWQRSSTRSTAPPSPAPQIIGFLGGQGSGKTTLTTLLKCLLELQDYRVLAWSIDDLYLPYGDRLQLQQQDPRLIWRGPPGTHDVALGLNVLNQFKRGQQPVAVPRFDKSCHDGAGDRMAFETVDPVDFVLFEGWCVGARPIAPCILDQPDLPAPIWTDADRTFAQDMNLALHEYLPLWEQLDRLVVMQLQDYRWSQQWRQQAEQQMRAKGLAGMSDQAIQEFVEYFWKSLHPELFITPLTQEPSWSDLVLEIGVDHLPDRVYRPSARA